MTYPQVWSNAMIRALPVGRLSKRTLVNIALARRVHFRAGPWVALQEDESRLVEVIEPAWQKSLCAEPEPFGVDADQIDIREEPLLPTVAEFLFAAHDAGQQPAMAELVDASPGTDARRVADGPSRTIVFPGASAKLRRSPHSARIPGRTDTPLRRLG